MSNFDLNVCIQCTPLTDHKAIFINTPLMADYVTGQCRASLWKLTSSLLALATDVKDKIKELMLAIGKQPQFKIILVPIGSFLKLRQVFENLAKKRRVS